jgi:hypothetical protein
LKVVLNTIASSLNNQGHFIVQILKWFLINIVNIETIQPKNLCTPCGGDQHIYISITSINNSISSIEFMNLNKKSNYYTGMICVED